MNTILFFLIFLIVCFVISIVAIGFCRKDALFTLAIGAVIGANIYNIGNYPIQIGNLIFGMDSVIYTIFAFSILYMYIDYGKQSMKTILYTAMFSIFFTALLAFFGSYLQNGSFSSVQIGSALSYIFSIIATYVAVICMIYLFDFLKKKNTNIYLNISLCLIVISIVNSLIYFSLSFLVNGSLGETFLLSLAGSGMGKFVALLFCLLSYFILTKVWKQKNKTQNEETNTSVQKTVTKRSSAKTVTKKHKTIKK